MKYQRDRSTFLSIPVLVLVLIIPRLLSQVLHFSASPIVSVSSFTIVHPTRIQRREKTIHFLEQQRRTNDHHGLALPPQTLLSRSSRNRSSTSITSTSLFAKSNVPTEKNMEKSRIGTSTSIDQTTNTVGVKEIELNGGGGVNGDSSNDEANNIDNQGDDVNSNSLNAGLEHNIGLNGDTDIDAADDDNRKGKKKKNRYMKNKNSKRKGGKSELFSNNSEKSSSSSSSPSSSPSYWTDWSASSSLGSFLLKRKKIEEEEMQKMLQQESTDTLNVGVGDDNLDTISKSDINEIQKTDENESKNEHKKDNDKDKTIQQKGTRGKDDMNRKEILNFVDTTSVQREIDQTIKNLASLTTGKKEGNAREEEGDKHKNNIHDNDSIDIDNEGEDILTGLDEELVREVDESITILAASRQNLMRDIEVLSTDQQSQQQKQSDNYDDMSSEKDNSYSSSSLLPLSGPDHTKRIERDMRHLAVSIASTVENAEQWKEFCEDRGGFLPLLECIRDGAKEIEEGINEQNSNANTNDIGMIGLMEQKEEAFVAAWTACKTLRDLCAISKPFAAIVTDSILRANIAWSTKVGQKDGSVQLEGGIISNLVTLLRFAQQDDNLYNPRSRREKMRALRNRGIQRMGNRRQKRDARKRCGLYVTQLLLEMSFASDEAVETFRATPGLTETVLACSSYAQAKRLRRRLIRYPIEVIKRYFSSKSNEVVNEESPFLAAASMNNGLSGQTQGAANQFLASIGHNVWYPKTPGQRGLRILCLDGGGTRGITAISSMRSIVQAIGGVEVCDAFDMIVGTSTGAIIAFLVGLRRESSLMARKRYDRLIKRIFVKSALSTPMLLFTTATYDETPFNTVVGEILRDNSMLSSRADPRVPLVFAISSKMSSTPTQICLFRNYNYGGGEMRDTFVEDPIEAKNQLDLELEDDIYKLSGMISYEEVEGIASNQSGGSRHPGSFRVLQRAALRATTAAPTVFKPVLMGGELYCDGGIVASNPAAVAIHEARTIYPSVPIELVVSCGTGAFVEEKSEPRIGWDGIIGQIVNSATDGEQIHHILEDILGGQGGTARLGRSSVSETKYYRFNPVIGTADTFPIDGTDPMKLEELSQLTTAYMNEPEQVRKLNEIVDILKGRTGWKGRLLSTMGINP